MMTITVMFLLVAGHALADYPLQGDFLARGKNRHNKAAYIPPGQTEQVIWPYCLTAHALIHGGTVYLITGSIVLGLAETAIHWVIDFGKCDNWYGIHMDQWLHILCKVLWAALILTETVGVV